MMPDKDHHVSLVTVVVAVCNGEPYLDEALRSVFSQDYPNVELVLVDDGSTDGTLDIARSHPGVRYQRQPNRGLPNARNEGIHMAEGELVTFLDADDVFFPERVSAQVEYLGDRPEVGCALARHELLLAPGERPPAWLGPDPIYGDLGGVEPGSAMLATRVARQIGFDPAYRAMDGVEWLSRLTAAGVAVGVCDRVLWRRRIHDRNMSGDRQALRDEMLRMVRNRIATGRSSTADADRSADRRSGR
jgi:glycosyltransferase involved in cell wall biosynthesis